MFRQLADSYSLRLRGSTAQSLWNRLTALFVLLVGLKALLVVALREDVFQSQWRIVGSTYTPLAAFNYYLFLAVTAGSLFLVGSRSAGFENGTLRRLNLAFVLVGCGFAFFSLKKVGTNYLFPTLVGWLNFRQIGDYLYLDAFFARPFYAWFLGVYLFGYWVLRLLRRESWSFHLLGILVLVYGLMNLQDLRGFGQELIAVNTFGIVSLWSACRRARPLGNGWILFLLALGVGTLQLFQPHLLSDEVSVRYMRFFCALTVTGLLVCWLLVRRSVAFSVVSHWVPFYFVSFLLLGNQSYPIATNLDHILVYALSTPQYLIQEAIALALFGGAALLISRTSPRWAIGFFDAGALLLVLAALADVGVSRLMGNRLDWHAITMSDDPILLWRTIRPHAVPVVAVLAVLWGSYWGGAWLLARYQSGRAPRDDSRPSSFAYVGAVSVLLALVSHWLVEVDKCSGSPVANLITTSPLKRYFDRSRLTPEQIVSESRELGIKDYSVSPIPQTRPQASLNVLLVILESTYNKHLSLFGSPDQTQPLLSKYKDRLELFPNYYAPFPNSLHARFAILNGLYPTVEYVSYLNPRISAPSLFEILKEQGYVNSLFYSSFRNYTRFNDYVGHRKLDHFYDCTDMPGREKYHSVVWGVEENCTLEAMKAQLARHAERRERFFLTYIPAAPHFPFDVPDNRFELFDRTKAIFGEDYTGSYKNGLLYMDWVVSSLIEKLSELGLLDHTLVVITGDHGEMTGGEDRFLGHGWRLDPQLCNVPLIIMDPRQPGFRVNNAPGCHVDILPTILSLLGIKLPAHELYQGVSLLDHGATAKRQIYLSSTLQRALITTNIFILDDPDLRRSWNSDGVKAFEIQISGSKTTFFPFECEKTAAVSRMDRFLKLQHSLIQYYDVSRDWVRANAKE